MKLKVRMTEEVVTYYTIEVPDGISEDALSDYLLEYDYSEGEFDQRPGGIQYYVEDEDGNTVLDECY